MGEAYVHKVNKKYKYFAVRKTDNKILTGFELISDVESLKHYANLDIIDLEKNPKDYKLLSKEFLIRKGIDPFNWENWIIDPSKNPNVTK